MSITLKNKKVVIRKDQTCFSCIRTYPKGAELYYYAGVYDGNFSSCYTCKTCRAIMDRCDEEDGFPDCYVLYMLDKGETPEQRLEILIKGDNR